MSALRALSSYTFPTHHLKRTLSDPAKTPLAVVSCGSYSPITFLHLRMLEMAADYIALSTEYELVGMYMSPVADAYKKSGLASAEHRLKMCELAASQSSEDDGTIGVMVDPWEALQETYTPTTEVLDHFAASLNEAYGVGDGGVRKPITVVLLAGADLIDSMSSPSVWTNAELEHILGGQYLTFVIERAGTDTQAALGFLKNWQRNIFLIPQIVENSISSSLVRLSLKNGLSVRYLVPDPVIKYMKKEELYVGDKAAPTSTSLAAIEARIGDTRIVSRQ